MQDPGRTLPEGVAEVLAERVDVARVVADEGRVALWNDDEIATSELE